MQGLARFLAYGGLAAAFALGVAITAAPVRAADAVPSIVWADTL